MAYRNGIYSARSLKLELLLALLQAELLLALLQADVEEHLEC